MLLVLSFHFFLFDGGSSSSCTMQLLTHPIFACFWSAHNRAESSCLKEWPFWWNLSHCRWSLFLSCSYSSQTMYLNLFHFVRYGRSSSIAPFSKNRFFKEPYLPSGEAYDCIVQVINVIQDLTERSIVSLLQLLHQYVARCTLCVNDFFPKLASLVKFSISVYHRGFVLIGMIVYGISLGISDMYLIIVPNG